MTVTASEPTARRTRRWSQRLWIENWEPEDPEFWASTGRRIANRNLVFSIFTEHIGFSIWSLWAVMVLFMGPKYGLSVADKFLLTSTPTLVGAIMRIPYNLAVARFGGRNWTVISAAAAADPHQRWRRRHASGHAAGHRSCSSPPSPASAAGTSRRR